MSDAPDALRRNRLDEEASPYLQQHADNPVHWQPWDETALEAARELDRPIFLSIGYSSCHWCHVMAEESFSDPDIAETVNEEFVPIKVDREERPDLDSLYITVCQLVRGHAGWPLTVFCTPEGKPFFVGTYFPKDASQRQPGFRQLVQDVADAWADPEQRAESEERAEQWTAAARGELEDVPDSPGELSDGLLADAADHAVGQADREYGGFGGGQKFPNPARVELLLRASTRGHDEAGTVARETLDAMASGGLYDHVGGGFHRYCTDREWVVPHFEKMLYDQAGLARVFLAGSQRFDSDRYASVARDTLDFLDRDLRHEAGGFFSTLDARSEHAGEQVEGAYYVWTPERVRAAIDDETDADLFAARYGIDERGNFPEGAEPDWTVLTETTSVGDLAASFGLPEDEIEDRLARARKQAHRARDDRPAPARDEKVLAGWNGLAVHAFAEAGLVFDGSYADTAVEALEFARERLWDGDRLTRRWKDGDAAGDGYLEDYAFLARGALATYEATGDVRHLDFACSLADALVAAFYDADAGTLYFTPEDGESLIARPQALDDSSTPSSTGVAVDVLDALAQFRPDSQFGTVARRVAETHAETVDATPLNHAALALATDALATGRYELTVAADSLPAAWRETLTDRYLPLRLLSVRPPTEDGVQAWLDALGLETAPPIWAGREARDGEPTVYACRNRTCSPPTHDLGEALDWSP
ncbi:thioredoxin domain-containing protein [Halosegnis longus]|uniref:Thioredoxin domain-containing protein n=1 Tax=Halosegnis longus TaxID=2216012 RepID=A0AAJ4UW60_9EURY|nr:thioredoxin domain-containing protein [Halosegnis longus]RNJ26600.1 thioredoxin domain-containing protein [Salella cibi]